jgi:hypothetical protein
MGVMEYWGIGKLGFTMTPVLQHSITPCDSFYRGYHG